MTKDTMTEEEPMVTDKERREAARELRGYGCGIYVVYRVFATGEPETVAFPFDMVEHIAGTGVLGCWLGDATGGKAIRELGYEIEEDEHGN